MDKRFTETAPGKRRRKQERPARAAGGKLRIGDDWSAITIIALSQSNPLKAIAEFVENSIDARAVNITVIRGKERGEHYLKVIDDGDGIPLNPEGDPDFKYVATHICDSIKKELKAMGIQGIQGEFGIGLLSFWTVGERMTLSSSGSDGRVHQMQMVKDDPGYTVAVRRALFGHKGTELTVRPLLPGLRQLSGEKMQSYLAAELRDRIRKSGVKIRIVDRASKRELEVIPRQFTGRLLHELGSAQTGHGEVYLELYLNGPDPTNSVGLFRRGTRVLASIAELDAFSVAPWSAGRFQGMIDAPFLQLTPGTRGGVVHDESLDELQKGLQPVAERLTEIIAQEEAAAEEETSRNILKTVQKAFREAFLALPPEEYDWFDIRAVHPRPGSTGAGAADDGSAPAVHPASAPLSGADALSSSEETREAPEREFFEYSGPLYGAVVSPASAVVRVGAERPFRCIPRDKSRRIIERDVTIRWRLREGEGRLSTQEGEIVTFTALAEPGLTMIEASASQGGITCTAEAIVTVTQTLLEREEGESDARGKGLPGYTFLRAPGELWRSRFDEKKNLVVINNGHRDFVFASQRHGRKLKYISRLFAKELVLSNFPGFDRRELLERMIELSLYVEEHLK
jgi:hypothetical protein